MDDSITKPHAPAEGDTLGHGQALDADQRLRGGEVNAGYEGKVENEESDWVVCPLGSL